MLFVLLNAGLSTNFTTCFFQIGGLLSSFFSVSKFCAEWHLFTAFNLNDDDWKIPTEAWSVFKAMLFFAPHSVFRTASLAFVTAFFRFYVLIPLSIYTFISISILTSKLKGDIKIKFMLVPAHLLLQIPFSIFTPTVMSPYGKIGRRQLKTTMLISTLLLLPCILLIRLLPLLPTSTIHCTLGLSFINLKSDDIPSCSPCFNPATDNITTRTNLTDTDEGF